MTLGDRVCVLRDGVLQQVDTPQNLFGQPANLFVACFIGSPAMNLATARLERAPVAARPCRSPGTGCRSRLSCSRPARPWRAIPAAR